MFPVLTIHILALTNKLACLTCSMQLLDRTLSFHFQPLYGLIQAKLELITHAYFEERDFSQVALLEETYRNLNAGLKASLLEGSQVFLGEFLHLIYSWFSIYTRSCFKMLLI